MFFVASKLVWAAAQPLAVIALLLAGGSVLLWTRWRRTGRALAGLGTCALLLVALLPLGDWIARPLEERFPPYRDDGAPVDGIIVLGGGSDVAVTEARQRLELNAAGDRLTALTALARRYPGAKLLFSGGSGDIFRQDLREADRVAAFLQEQGIDPARLTVENRSRNTWENALFSARAISGGAGQRWLLVTSAIHMPRSVGCFRQAGMAVIPYPVDYRTMVGSAGFRLDFDGNLSLFSDALREWVGLIAYWMTSRTSELFPRPA